MPLLRRPDLLRHRGLPRLLAAQAPADLADWLDFVALGGLLVFHWDAGPLALAWLAFALGLPYVLVGPLMGVLVDRMPLRASLVASNLGRAAATAALVLADTVPALLAIVFLRGCADSAFTPARQVAIQALVPPEARGAANGASHAINQATKIAGPALGGLLLTVLDPQQVFLGNAGISLVAAVLLAGLPRGLGRRPEDRSASVAADDDTASRWRTWALVRARPRLRLAILLMSGGFFAMFFYDALIPLLTRALGHSEQVFGAAIAAVGAGGVPGAAGLAVARAGRPFARMGIGYAVSALVSGGLGVAALGQTAISAGAFAGLFALLGLATALTVVPYRTVLQDEAPPDGMGRVAALGEAVSTTALLAAPFAGGALAAALGVGAAFAAGGAVLLLLAVMAWIGGGRAR